MVLYRNDTKRTNKIQVVVGCTTPSKRLRKYALLRFSPSPSRRILSSHMISHLLPDRTANASTDDAGELFAAHGKQVADCEAHEENKTDGEKGDEPECDTDVLLLACRSAPNGGLDVAILVLLLGSRALAAVAVALLAVGSVAVVVELTALAVTGAVACGGLALLLRAEARRQDAGQRRSLVGKGCKRGGHGCFLNGRRSSFEDFGERLLGLAFLEGRLGVGHAVASPARGIGSRRWHEDDGHGWTLGSISQGRLHEQLDVVEGHA